MLHQNGFSVSQVVDTVFLRLQAQHASTVPDSAVQAIADALDAAGLSFSEYLNELTLRPPSAPSTMRWRFSQRERTFQRVTHAVAQLCANSANVPTNPA